MRKRVKRIVLGLLILPLLLAVTALLFPRPFLALDDGPAKADVIILLGGGSHERYERAVELFRARAAPRIIVSGFGDCEINRYLLVQAGVPARAIQLESQSRTTRENAQFTIRLLREQKVKRAIIVTSWYHSRRALACFWHYAPDLTFYSEPTYSGSTRSHRSYNRDGGRARLEYLKLLGYWVRYGILPF